MTQRHWLKIRSAPGHPNLLRLWIVKGAAILGALVQAQGISAEPSAPLPGIIARSFQLTVLRRSNSNLTYMLKSPDDGSPELGRILLVRKEEEPIIALRVLKDYPEKGSFAAKRVRRYADHRILDTKETYLAIEKVSNLDGAPLPPQTAQDQADLKELEAPPPTAGGMPPSPPGAEGAMLDPGQPQAPGATPSQPDAGALQEPPSSLETPESPVPETSEYDPELDSGSSPAPNEEPKAQSNLEENTGVAVEEVRELDPYRHMVSAQFGYMTNQIPTSSRHLFMGGGFRYAFTPFRQVFLRKGGAQDSISFETGLFVYKIVGLLAQSGDSVDTYTVLPVPLTIRYNVALSETFSLFAYGGMLMNFVVGSTSGYAEAVTALNTFGSGFSPIPALGIGVLFRVGPNWAARADVGYDFIGAGLVLKF
jgi:hypothetical protein